MKYIAVSGCELEVTSAKNSEVASVSITSIASENTSIDNKGVYAGVYAGDITVAMVGIVNGSFVLASATTTISPSSNYVTVDGDAVILEGDTGSVNVTLTNPNTGATMTDSLTVKIKSAGQDVVQAD